MLIQSNSWYASIVEFVARAAFAIALYWIRRKSQGEKQNFADSMDGAAVGLIQGTL